MATFNYSGTYMSSWLQPDGTTYLPGPVVVDASTESVSLNGVTIIQPQFNSTANTLSWSSSSGNYSSAQLTFYQNNNVNGFVGMYAQGSNSLPASKNLFGSASIAQQSLSTWNGTYHVYLNQGTQSTGTMVVKGNSVTYLKSTISGFKYTGEVPPKSSEIDQLAWFTPSGNSQNMILQFAKDKSGDLTFYGTTWTGGNQPTEINVTGTTASSPTPPQVTMALILVMTTETSTEVTTEVTTEVITEVVTEVAAEVVAVEVEVVAAVAGLGGAQGKISAADPNADASAANDLVKKATFLAEVE